MPRQEKPSSPQPEKGKREKRAEDFLQACIRLKNEELPDWKPPQHPKEFLSMTPEEKIAFADSAVKAFEAAHGKPFHTTKRGEAFAEGGSQLLQEIVDLCGAANRYRYHGIEIPSPDAMISSNREALSREVKEAIAQRQRELVEASFAKEAISAYLEKIYQIVLADKRLAEIYLTDTQSKIWPDEIARIVEENTQDMPEDIARFLATADEKDLNPRKMVSMNLWQRYGKEHPRQAQPKQTKSWWQIWK